MISDAPVALPGILEHLAPTLDRYGYLAVGGFVFLEDFGVPVPGETILIAAAVYAGAGRLNPVLVGILAVVAAVLGDNLGFAIGHFAGRAVILRYGRLVGLTDERLAKAEHFFNVHGGKVIVIARFVEGLRQANGIVAGASEMSWLRFLPFNFLGACLWVTLWLSVGDAAGGHITAIYTDVTRYSLWALVAAAAVLAGYVATKVSRRRHGGRLDAHAVTLDQSSVVADGEVNEA